jgi:outer membrane protein OmpA-like peptidoglycan-associated protein
MANMLTRTEAPNGLIRQNARMGAFTSLMAACLLAGFESAPVQAQGMTLDICPTDYGSFPENAPQLTCGCDAESVKEGNVRGANPYYYQSSLCRAALHAGAIGAQGGQIVVKPEKATIFPAVPRNGVTADSWGEGMGFRVVAAAQPLASTPPPATGTATPPQATGMTLDVCPTDYGSFPENAPQLTCGCDAASVTKGNVRGANPYYYQSSLCRAALHAGAIGAQGGQVVVRPEKATVFPAVPRNGVTADSWGEGMGFRVAVAGQQPSTVPAAGTGSAATPSQATGMTLDVCPTNYGSFREDSPPLTCGCDTPSVKQGNVRGANPYYYQSSLCRAALHAGAIGVDGGQIVVQPKKSPLFPAVTRNGVAADSWGQGMGFSVTAAAGGRPSASPILDAGNSAGMTLDVCPTNYGSFPEDAPPLTCGCDAAAAKQGNVRGANPYYYQSSVCRAALHAGAIGAGGGKIVVKPEKAAVFPAVTRNGVKADSWGQGMGFNVTAVPGATPVAAAPRPAVDASGKPIQAPIAETLRATGRVQLYINFATDQDKPLPSSEPVLRELLATLQGDAALRVVLIGHTDSQGSAPHNLDLSQRRAAAVYLWLVQRGVDSGRLRSDGRGLMEPIADNATEQGRALNRRVEVKATN